LPLFIIIMSKSAASRSKYFSENLQNWKSSPCVKFLYDGNFSATCYCIYKCNDDGFLDPIGILRMSCTLHWEIFDFTSRNMCLGRKEKSYCRQGTWEKWQDLLFWLVAWMKHMHLFYFTCFLRVAFVFMEFEGENFSISFYHCEKICEGFRAILWWFLNFQIDRIRNHWMILKIPEKFWKFEL